MKNLKEIRNQLLSLHKILLDIERENYEAEYGRVTNLQLLNLLFENQNFAWLREISGLVAQIDELFSSKTVVDQNLAIELFEKVNGLFDDTDKFKQFKRKYQANLDTESLVSNHHEILMGLLKK